MNEDDENEPHKLTVVPEAPGDAEHKAFLAAIKSGDFQLTDRNGKPIYLDNLDPPQMKPLSPRRAAIISNGIRNALIGQILESRHPAAELLEATSFGGRLFEQIRALEELYPSPNDGTPPAETEPLLKRFTHSVGEVASTSFSAMFMAPQAAEMLTHEPHELAVIRQRAVAVVNEMRASEHAESYSDMIDLLDKASQTPDKRKGLSIV